MIHNSKYILKKELSSKANAHHDVADFKFHGCWEIEKTDISRMEHDFSMK